METIKVGVNLEKELAEIAKDFTSPFIALKRLLEEAGKLEMRSNPRRIKAR